MVRDRILEVLEKNRGNLVSGGELSRQLDVSRTAIWKAISSLKDLGFEIESVKREGYRLLSSNNIMTNSGINLFRKSKIIGNEILILDDVTSTNTLLKTEYSHKNEGFTVVSHKQSEGRGRLGRTFHSDFGKGIYMSVLLKPSVSLDKINFITILVAAAVSDAIQDCCKFSPEIKWVNDIYKNEKKLCGILTEASIVGESASVEHVIVGIGINVSFGDCLLPNDISSIAGSLDMFSEKLPVRNEIVGNIVSKLDFYYTKLVNGDTKFIINKYRSRLAFLGQKITVIKPSKTYTAIAKSVNNMGHLIVTLPTGKEETLISGEISIKL